MAPNSETVKLNPPIQGRKILPEGGIDRPPAQAWIENEEPNASPGESKKLLPIPQTNKPKSKLDAGLTLGVHYKYPSLKKQMYKKTKFQIMKEKLIAALRPPYFIISIIVVMISIRLFVANDIKEKMDWSPRDFKKEPWRLLSYGFLHATTTHLATNAVVALAIGWLLEREQGWWRIVLVWFAGVVAGALGAGVLQPTVRVVGSSAAVYALLTAHIPNVCFRYGHIPLWWFRPLSIVVLAISDGCWAVMRSSTVSGTAAAHTQTSVEQVAWGSHLFGAAVGAPLAFLVFTGENGSKVYIQVLRMLSALILTTGIIVSTLHFTVWHETKPA